MRGRASPDAPYGLVHLAQLGDGELPGAEGSAERRVLEFGASAFESVAAKRAEYEEDVDLMRLASELVIDGIVAPENLRAELVRRYTALDDKHRPLPEKRHGVPPG